MKKKPYKILAIQLVIISMLFACGGDKEKVATDVPVTEEEEEVTQDAGGNYVPDGHTKIWEDHFDGTEINTAHWTVGSLRDPETGDIVPGADGDHLLKTKYSGYVTKEDSYLEDGALVLRNQKRSFTGTSPAGNYS